MAERLLDMLWMAKSIIGDRWVPTTMAAVSDPIDASWSNSHLVSTGSYADWLKTKRGVEGHLLSKVEVERSCGGWI